MEVILLDCSEKVLRWEKYHEDVNEIFSEINDIFKTRCWYDDKWQYHEEPYQPDEETPYLKKLAELLKSAHDFTKQHLDELHEQLNKEYQQAFNAELAFEAWRRNLCPQVMKNIPRYFNANSFDRFETYDEVASFLTENVISFQDTQKAVRLWLLSKINAA